MMGSAVCVVSLLDALLVRFPSTEAIITAKNAGIIEKNYGCAERKHDILKCKWFIFRGDAFHAPKKLGPPFD